MITSVLRRELVFFIRAIVIVIFHKWRTRRCTVSTVSRASLQESNENWSLKELSHGILGSFAKVTQLIKGNLKIVVY